MSFLLICRKIITYRVKRISESELIINPDGSIYHLGLCPGEIASVIITVGDPDRVELISQKMDDIYLVKNSREFVTHTGRVGKRDVSVISTGIGTDNIDIVLNELDALVNIDFGTRTVKDSLTSLQIIRIGTTGLVQSGAPVDQILATSLAIDASGLSPWYDFNYNSTELEWIEALGRNLGGVDWSVHLSDPNLAKTFAQEFKEAVAFTASGFYAPQGRSLRGAQRFPDLLNQIAGIKVNGNCIDNIEMETAGIYGLSKVLGHRAIAVNAALANRSDGHFSNNPAGIIDEMIIKTLNVIEGL